MTVLFLYTEVADYFIKCCESLAHRANVHIIRWPVNKEAPFAFSFSDKLKVYSKNEFDFKALKQLIKGINPDVIVCSGWIDKDYLKLVKPYYQKIPTVLTCDTHWTGSLKQQLARILSPLFLLNKFSHAWVPGSNQATYVKHLGFKANKIHLGFYCCDLDRFNGIYASQTELKKNNIPKKFLFVGRYYEFKGINDLWDAFIELQNETPNDWDLWCLGTGSVAPCNHTKIKHFGFVQPKDMEEITKQCGVFVLPSHFEPWGVVVQEFAASGFPILTSKAVGSSEVFLTETENGFSFEAKNKLELKNALKKIITLSNAELIKLATNSHELAQAVNQTNWVGTLLKIYNEFNPK